MSRCSHRRPGNKKPAASPFASIYWLGAQELHARGDQVPSTGSCGPNRRGDGQALREVAEMPQRMNPRGKEGRYFLFGGGGRVSFWGRGGFKGEAFQKKEEERKGTGVGNTRVGMRLINQATGFL